MAGCILLNVSDRSPAGEPANPPSHYSKMTLTTRNVTKPICRFFLLAFILITSGGCVSRAFQTDANSSTPDAVLAVNPGWACTPTDQDQFVYRPARLRALVPCVRVTGTIVSSSMEADGDYHIQVRLDAPYSSLLNAGNDAEDGNLIVEPICQFPPLQADSLRVCASNPNPLQGPLPVAGDHVWMEGRYALDLQHHGWAELHPLYRWGMVSR